MTFVTLMEYILFHAASFVALSRKIVDSGHHDLLSWRVVMFDVRTHGCICKPEESFGFSRSSKRSLQFPQKVPLKKIQEDGSVSFNTWVGLLP